MITYWKHEGELAQVSGIESNCWIEVTGPTDDEINFLSQKMDIPTDVLQDVLDIDERSRLDFDDAWNIIILRLPIQHKYNGVPYITVPLGILMSKDYVVTICSHENEIIPEIVRAVRLRKVDFNKKVDFILSIFQYSAIWYLKFLKLINMQTNFIERDLEKSTRNKELHKLLRMEKCLVYFITSLKSNELLVAKLRNSKFVKNNEFDEDLLDDVIIENKQALEMANIYSDILSGMMDAFASVISNNLNQVMKQLTSVTIILMIPTLIASLYGMNVPNNFERNPFGFVIILVMSLVISTFGVYLFRKKNWF